MIDKGIIAQTVVGLTISGLSATATHLWHWKRNKRELQQSLIDTIEELSEKYLELNTKLIKLSDEIMRLQQENQSLKSQITILKNCSEHGR